MHLIGLIFTSPFLLGESYLGTLPFPNLKNANSPGPSSAPPVILSAPPAIGCQIPFSHPCSTAANLTLSNRILMRPTGSRVRFGFYVAHVRPMVGMHTGAAKVKVDQPVGGKVRKMTGQHSFSQVGRQILAWHWEGVWSMPRKWRLTQVQTIGSSIFSFAVETETTVFTVRGVSSHELRRCCATSIVCDGMV